MQSISGLLAVWALQHQSFASASFMNTESCCRSLQLLLPGRVSFLGHDAYNLSIQSYWSQQEQSVTPSCIVSPQNENDVSKAISILSSALTFVGADRSKSCQFAIRGGGHAPSAGSANINNGITIDLSAINTINADPDKTLVSVGPGNKWIDVYLKLDALGLAVPGGRVADIGVAGLTTGGGMSYFAPRFGFVCDNVMNFRVVLANGKIVNANANVNSDLWVALKGGSNNFGVITRLDFKTFVQGDLWAGWIYNPMETYPTQIRAFAETNAASDSDVYASLINSYAYSATAGGMAIANSLVYTKAEAYPAIFKSFANIQPQILNTMRIQNLSNFLLTQGDFQPVGQRYSFVTRTYKNDADLLKSAVETWNATLQTILPVTNLTSTITFQCLPTSVTSRAVTTGGNALGLEANKESLVLAVITSQWSAEADDSRVENMAEEVFTRTDVEAESRNLTNRWVYLNYAGPFQDPITGYGEANKMKLQAVSKKYDPRGIFQFGVPGGFKVFTD